MVKVLFLVIGGAIGTALRYGLIEYVQRSVLHAFPLGVLAVNLTGSFFIGLCWSIFEVLEISPNIRIFLFAGLFGGFTTFSTFALDTMVLMKAGEYKLALFNVLASNILGIIVVFLGFCLGKYILTLIK
ncbi:CrcB protein [Parabacteroides sp. PF5-5]|uniref:fluoride efflux transporter CrcB n=1 Tax=unclassified Parabacteroides TaxID=2649774 RepID=UPI0024758C8B|nr:MULTISPECIES: fluoride efflux transporter CrcB [unclassified Parabacteroides]MDH6307036.1 CrcB protein [Parabacteroides sp. PH5-39]MDH6317951.1 CrcB protein [Parabacteroides sp. PF5-13]MDH6321696.1 CrcB protein [Parabacteroides sp. PH5-13]MDH6325447.1 CrcB protein [Parabacteroides sp. PH5-8]MDH6329158.1 CrcB protein [Parabacteroides sp. PH5-41]